MHADLLETLRQAQRFGFFGDRPIEEAVEHAIGFVNAIGELAVGARVVDIGSGGGLPGLVVAETYRHADVTLIDRRQKRTDFLERAARRLGYAHVDVRCLDVAILGRAIGSGAEQPFDVVTARGFGPPDVTLRLARALTHRSGMIVISEPPSADRWQTSLLDELGLVGVRVGTVRIFTDRSTGPTTA
jgi:16S rRNA (guanine527-N7)-methyltransferase